MALVAACALAFLLTPHTLAARIQLAGPLTRLMSNSHFDPHDLSASHVQGRSQALQEALHASREGNYTGNEHLLHQSLTGNISVDERTTSRQNSTIQTQSFLEAHAAKSDMDSPNSSRLRHSIAARVADKKSERLSSALAEVFHAGVVANASHRLSSTLVAMVTDSVLSMSMSFWFLSTGLGFLLLICCCSACTQATAFVKSSTGRNRYFSKERIIYEWDQTASTITMYTKPPGGLSKHNIEVMVWPKNVKIGRRGKPPFLKEELYALVDAEASTWSITRNGELQIRLLKVEEGEWPCVLLAHESSSATSWSTKTVKGKK